MPKPETHFRYFRAQNEDFHDGDDERTLDVCFSSETPLLRRDKAGAQYYEVLSHDSQDADLSLIQDGGAFLDEHLRHRQIGSIRKAYIDASDRRGRALLSFAKTNLGNERFRLMADGHRGDISVGYELLHVTGTTRAADGHPVKRFAWRALEISSVSLGADHGATGVGRNFEFIKENKISMTNDELQQLAHLQQEFTRTHPHADTEIRAFHARALCDENMTIQQYKRDIWQMLEKCPPKPNVKQIVMPGEIGMGQRDIQQYSIARAIRSAAENRGKPDGFEGDVSRQVEINSRMSSEGFFIPVDLVMGGNARSYGQRDMLATDFPSGGAFVPTIVQTPIIELLRNKSVCLRAGATMLAGLTGNVAVPRQTSAANAQSLPETGEVQDSQAVIDQVRLVPHRVSASTTYSRQLVIQSAPDVEAFVRDDLIKVIALKHDYLLIAGQGAADEPNGLLNTASGKIAFGGSPTWAKVVAFETQLGKFNADRGNLAYVTTPDVKGAWKTTAVALTGATTVSSRALWEEGNFNDGSADGIVNGHRAIASNQLSNGTVLFGNWADLVFAMWSGLEMIVDPYTKAKNAEIVVVCHTFIDTVLRHPESFCVSTDSGAQ